MEIARVQKVEGLSAYVRARARTLTFTIANIRSAFRGASLIYSLSAKKGYSSRAFHSCNPTSARARLGLECAWLSLLGPATHARFALRRAWMRRALRPSDWSRRQGPTTRRAAKNVCATDGALRSPEWELREEPKGSSTPSRARANRAVQSLCSCSLGLFAGRANAAKRPPQKRKATNETTRLLRTLRLLTPP